MRRVGSGDLGGGRACLWTGLERPLATRPEIRGRTHRVVRINQITSYRQYLEIIDGCRDLARELGCRLIEVEQFWQGADGPAEGTG